MKGRNPLTIILVVLVLLGGVVAVFLSMGNGGENIGMVKTDGVQNPVGLSQDNLDGDRLPQEFGKIVIDLQSVQSDVTSLNDKIDTLEKENSDLKNNIAANSNAENGLNKPDEKIFSLPVFNGDTPQEPHVLGGGIEKFTAPIGMVSGKVVSTTNQKITQFRGQPLSTANATEHATGIIWLDPLDSGFSQSKKSNRSGQLGQPLSMLADLDKNKPSALSKSASNSMNKMGLSLDVDPRFTIPNGSIISQSLLVTAMVGRIPVDGQVTDPWRFKISTGRRIVMPNDHELQGLEKIIVQGDAIGDLNLRCVKGQIDTMTFIFSDGRIVTHTSKQGGSRKDGGALGYLSDQYANPCIPGKLITNAPQAIAQMGLLGIASGMADGISEAETQTTVTDQGSVIKNVVGDQLKYAGYKGLASGINDVKGWFATRMGQYFDVIYANAGQVVDIHITNEIKLDYDPAGRKVIYEKNDADSLGYMD